MSTDSRGNIFRNLRAVQEQLELMWTPEAPHTPMQWVSSFFFTVCEVWMCFKVKIWRRKVTKPKGDRFISNVEKLHVVRETSGGQLFFQLPCVASILYDVLSQRPRLSSLRLKLQWSITLLISTSQICHVLLICDFHLEWFPLEILHNVNTKQWTITCALHSCIYFWWVWCPVVDDLPTCPQS